MVDRSSNGVGVKGKNLGISACRTKGGSWSGSQGPIVRKTVAKRKLWPLGRNIIIGASKSHLTFSFWEAVRAVVWARSGLQWLLLVL